MSAPPDTEAPEEAAPETEPTASDEPVAEEETPEAPTAEEADDTRENAGLVVHQHGDDVFVFLHIRS